MNTNKTVIITGGTKGIGKGASLEFAKKGYNVVISARNEAPELLREIKNLGGEAIFIKTDISKEEDIVKLVDETVKKYGKLDVLVNNAAITGSMNVPLTETTTKNFEEVFQANVLGTYWGMKYAIQAMLQTGGGSIVNVSSIAGLKGIPLASHYVASKHALMGLTKSTAIEYATKNIRINIVAPGSIRTEMFEAGLAQGGFTEDMLKKSNPMNKIGDVDDIAKAILFLSSDEAPFMTGAVLSVDGGYSVQ
jgi:NAD(P)-dependent dehydrogenase (short-subunit alcohol dehydrogenase family)